MRPKLVLFGDSITERSFDEGGWGASLANRFTCREDVILRGYRGYNTRFALKIIEKTMEGIGGDGKSSVTAVTLFFGANDAALPDRRRGLLHVPLDEYQKNLRTLYAYFKKIWPSAVVIFITPPPIYEEARIKNAWLLPEEDTSGLPERTNEAAGEFAKACITIAKECSSPVIDIWSKMQQVPDWEKSTLSDGLHLAALGNKVLFEEVLRELKALGLSDETLPADAPPVESLL